AEGDYAAARSLQEESRALYERVGSKRQVALVLLALGEIARAEREIDRARSLLGEGLSLLAELRDGWSIALALDHFAALAADEGRFETAERLGGAAARVYQQSGTAPWPVVQRECERWRELAREALRKEASRAWNAGLALPLERAVAEALSTAACESAAPLTIRS